MHLPAHKTKIVATIGPASRSPEMIERLVRAGLSVARLNFSHGTFDDHARAIEILRRTASALGLRVAILADLPGPKMRLGTIEPGPVTLEAGAAFTLTTRSVTGNAREASMSFERLPEVVKPGDRLFVNDGLVQLVVEQVNGPDVHCKVAVGGEISSKKGLNIPNIPLGVSAFTARDRECLEFAIRAGVDAVSQSFVESAQDIETVRKAAGEIGGDPFLIAKIERSAALDNFDSILRAADGIMVARGDLGIEVPIEEMAILQKKLIAKANVAGKPVITATQMLESMTSSRLPTRAEATDVANAILDGTDCVMLSAESAAGQFPEESVAMLARIAAVTEAHRPAGFLDHQLAKVAESDSEPDILARLVGSALKTVDVDTVVTPALSGSTARGVARFRSPAWILATGAENKTMQDLVFSYGVHPLDLAEGTDWKSFAREALLSLEPRPKQALFVSGPSPAAPDHSRSIELVELSGGVCP